jgi:hypothetical protein
MSQAPTFRSTESASKKPSPFRSTAGNRRFIISPESSAQLSRNGAINRPQMTQINANFRMKKGELVRGE